MDKALLSCARSEQVTTSKQQCNAYERLQVPFDLDQSSSHQSDNRGTSSNEASSRAVSVDLGILCCRVARESVVASVDVDDERTSDGGSIRLSSGMSKRCEC